MMKLQQNCNNIEGMNNHEHPCISLDILLKNHKPLYIHLYFIYRPELEAKQTLKNLYSAQSSKLNHHKINIETKLVP